MNTAEIGAATAVRVLDTDLYVAAAEPSGAAEAPRWWSTRSSDDQPDREERGSISAPALT